MVAATAAAATLTLLTWDGAERPALLVLAPSAMVGGVVYIWGVFSFGAARDLYRVRTLLGR